jgi:hypothetical protein
MVEYEVTSCHERMTGREGWLAPASGFYPFGRLFKSAGATPLPDLISFHGDLPSFTQYVIRMVEDEVTSCHERVTGREGWLAPLLAFTLLADSSNQRGQGLPSRPDILPWGLPKSVAYYFGGGLSPARWARSKTSSHERVSGPA